MKSGKSNVIPKLKSNKMGEDFEAGGHSEASEGVIPPSHLRAHGLEVKKPQDPSFDSKKQSSYAEGFDNDDME